MPSVHSLAHRCGQACVLSASLLAFATTAQAQLQSGGEYIANISPIGDVDTWTVPVNAGDTLIVQAGERSGADFEPQLRLYDDNNNLVISNWGYISTAITHQATSSGTYTLQLSDATNPDNGFGEYQLYYVRVPAPLIVPTGDEGGQLTNGGQHSGELTLGDVDVWTIDLAAEDHLLVQIDELTGADFEPQLRLFGPNGDFETSNWGYDSTAIRFRVATAGRYTVVVNDATDDVQGVGTYELYATAVPGEYQPAAGDEGGGIANGGVVSGNLPQADTDTFTFTLEANATLWVQAGETSGTDFDPQLTIYGPDGRLAASDWGYASTSAAYHADVGGLYTVVLNDATGDAIGTGTYDFHAVSVPGVITVPVGDQGGALTSGQPVSGTISLGDMDAWQFNLAAGESVFLQATELNGTTLDPQLRLFDPSGHPVGTDWGYDAAQLDYTATTAGVYTVLLQDADGDAAGSGDYVLNFFQAPSVPAVPGGDDGGALATGINSAAITAGDVDIWTFSGDQLDAVTIAVNDTDVTDFTPVIVLYGPEGDLLDSNWGYIDASIATQLPVGGTYYAVVRDYDGAAINTGNYTVDFGVVADTSSVPGGSVLASLSNGGRVDGQFEVIDDIDKFHLAVNAGDKVILKLAEVGASTAAVSPLLQVFGGSGQLLAQTGGLLSAEVYFTAPATQTLTVVAANAAGGTGSYQLYTAIAGQAYGVPGGDEGGMLVSGDLISGLQARGDLDMFSLSVDAGDKVRVKLAEASGSTSGHTPRLRVFDSSGSLLASTEDFISAEVYVSAPANDVLTIVASNSATGDNVSYQLGVAVAGQPVTVGAGDEGGPVVNGEFVSANLVRADLDIFELPVKMGQEVQVRFGEFGSSSSSAFSPRVEVFGEDGRLLAVDADQVRAGVKFRAEQDETLTIIAGNTASGALNSYELQASVASQAYRTLPGDQGGALHDGVVTPGSLARGDMDHFTVSAVAGTDITVTMAEAGGASSGHSPRVRVYRPNGQLVATDSSASTASVTFRAPATEQLLIIASNDANGVANYELTASNVGSAIDGDLDGLLDSEEALAGTDPLNPDTDGDGMPDKYELDNGLNPLVDDAGGDLDGDGVSNIDEYLGGTDPNGALSGDVNGDGMVSLADLLVVQQYLLNAQSLDAAAQSRGDLNSDGVLDLADQLALQQLLRTP